MDCLDRVGGVVGEDEQPLPCPPCSLDGQASPDLDSVFLALEEYPVEVEEEEALPREKMLQSFTTT
jgi:hypothetical protein